ncbi:MAG: SHOCT domain-containing protein [Candidatus Sericytochromatia bacterium]
MKKEDKITDIFKLLDPTTLLKLENLNISNVLKQLEQLKLSGFLEKIEELNKVTKLLKEMEEIKLSELIKKIEDVRLSSIIKQIEENKIQDLLANPLDLNNREIPFNGGVIKIETKEDSPPDMIKKLFELKKQGIITEEEFSKKKKALLDKI